MSERWMSKTSGFAYRRSSRFADAIDNRMGLPAGTVVP